MIRHLEGKILDTVPVPIVEVGGIGYRVFCAGEVNENEDVKLWIYHHIREDRQDLYGFLEKGQLLVFEQLLAVSGVGPKVALLILKNLSPEKINQAITEGDSSILSSVSGVGKKLAIKIIIELKSKMEKMGKIDFEKFEQSSEIFEGLKMLGYAQKEIYAIIKKIPNDLKTASEKITWAIKNIKAEGL
ncbi:MAG: holliday junction DNA helicase RuvA [Candidatus Berkelbacteria bacterium Licking1014_7]|uniref:Holliday junction branch migration complex subunit RuvA n=1 Tax=Candidatus Berkelbacteria bacterium Licking1014_7 TaxID=2017147 RepID=A0A554LHG6_9BACT|nr:MAG: holliday junction DNA helicase RuvA [Candidatus Berkelbacteria bacterium Licking1014_7]